MKEILNIKEKENQMKKIPTILAILSIEVLMLFVALVTSLATSIVLHPQRTIIEKKSNMWIALIVK